MSKPNREPHRTSVKGAPATRLKRHLAGVERAMGVLMMLTGIGFLTGTMSSISIWLLETFPSLADFG